MSQQLHPPQPVKLIVGMLSRDQRLFTWAERHMQELWGPIDVHGAVIPFTQTDYYAAQMGTALQRKFIAFADLIDPAQLAALKHQSNALEARCARTDLGRALGVARPINLDPGYVAPGKLVLATTKDYAHRIYLGRSMYAEATLHYHGGRWHCWPYTYPDYAGGAYDDFLNQARRRLMEQRSS